MMLASAIFSTVITLLVVFTSRDKPGVPMWSTKASQKKPSNNSFESEIPIKEQWRLCFNNKTFMFTAMSSCSVMIHMYLFTTIIGQLVYTNGLTDTAFVTTMGLYLQTAGIIGGIVFAMVLSRYPDKLYYGSYTITIGCLLSLAFFVIGDH